METETKKSWTKKLWDRKVPQYLGTYFALGFGLLQFLEFITKRYELSEFWVDKYLLVWLALIPAIILIAYFSSHLTPSLRSKSLKWPKFLIIGNIGIAVLLGALLFNGEAIAQSEVIELTDEKGQKITAVIPKLNTVKTVACFQFENSTGDTTLDWWSVAFANLLEFNLDQRPEFYSYSPYSLYSFYDGAGLNSFEIPNVGIQRKIAQKSRNDYFIRVSYDKEGDTFVLKGNLYETKTGNSILSINAKNEDPYATIDAVKEQIFENIPNPLTIEGNEVNLPASALLTSNQEALKQHTLSRIAFYQNPSGLQKVVQLAKKAIELDPTCSYCQYYVGDPLYGLGKREEALIYIKNAIKYGASLPKRMQFAAKGVLYSITDNTDAYLKLQEVHRKMYPYDFGPYNQLLPLYKSKYGIDKAKELVQEAIDNGNLEKGLLTMYNLQLENEEFEDAKVTLDRLSTEFPEREQDKVKYTTIYERQGELDKARELLLEQETLDPLSTDIQRRLAYLDYRDLQQEKAFDRLNQGIDQATTLTDSLQFMSLRMHFLRMSGQIQKAFNEIETIEKLSLKRAPINQVIISTFTAKVDMYQSIGQSAKAHELLEEIRKYSPEKVNYYECMAASGAIIKDYDPYLEFEKISLCNKQYQFFGKGYDMYFKLIIAYHAKDYETCTKILQEDDGRVINLFFEKTFLVNVYIKTNQLDKAKALLQKMIDQKDDDAIYYYQMALVLEKEDPNAAKKYLDTALQYWSKADENYIPFRKAKSLEATLSSL
ncbi:hypothetical protein GCM10009430_29200 [Aquimarina litoralis]|uniref:Tetratricopeptide repeat protein n=1 Tax=Aquimarina litoralis TaxID=584605 RepID=A0ABN1IZI8_9FLAO